MFSTYSGNFDSSKNFTSENYPEFTSDALTRMAPIARKILLYTLKVDLEYSTTQILLISLKTIQTRKNKESDSTQNS